MLLAEEAITGLPSWLSWLIPFLGGGAGLWVINAFIAWKNAKSVDKKQTDETVLAKQKLDGDQKLAENDQAFKIFKDILEGLRKDLGKVTDDLHKLEDENQGYKEQVAKQNLIISTQNTTIETQNTKMKDLEIFYNNKIKGLEERIKELEAGKNSEHT